MLRNRKLLATITLVLIIGITALILFQQVVNHCEGLLTAQPSIDVIPRAEILHTTSTRTGGDYSFFAALLGATEHSEILTEYTVDSDYEDVIAFYQQRGECSDTEEGNTICYGQAHPIGSYYIGIDTLPASSKTHFFIQLNWDLCGSEL